MHRDPQQSSSLSTFTLAVNDLMTVALCAGQMYSPHSLAYTLFATSFQTQEAAAAATLHLLQTAQALQLCNILPIRIAKWGAAASCRPSEVRFPV